MGDVHVGLQARLMSQALRKLTAHISKSRTTCIFINQIREKVGIVYGSPETTTGAGVEILFLGAHGGSQGDPIKQGTELIGNRTKVKIVKNKVAPLSRPQSSISSTARISKEGDLLDIAAEMDIIQKSGSWFSYQGERLGQGRENAKEYLKNNPDFAKNIENLIREKLALRNAQTPAQQES